MQPLAHLCTYGRCLWMKLNAAASLPTRGHASSGVTRCALPLSPGSLQHALSRSSRGPHREAMSPHPERPYATALDHRSSHDAGNGVHASPYSCVLVPVSCFALWDSTCCLLELPWVMQRHDHALVHAHPPNALETKHRMHIQWEACRKTELRYMHERFLTITLGFARANELSVGIPCWSISASARVKPGSGKGALGQL